MTCFSKPEVHKIAEFKKSCDAKDLDFYSVKESLRDCRLSKVCTESWYKSDMAIVGIGIFTFLLGTQVGGK